MKRVIETSEVVGTVETPQGACEVCATGVANHDEEAGRLVVELSAYLRTTDLRAKQRRLSADWLPPPETIRENVGPDDALEMARDIFHCWVRKVRAAAPAPLHHE